MSYKPLQFNIKDMGKEYHVVVYSAYADVVQRLEACERKHRVLEKAFKESEKLRLEGEFKLDYAKEALGHISAYFDTTDDGFHKCELSDILDKRMAIAAETLSILTEPKENEE